MKIGFIPGYACTAAIFDKILPDFPQSFCVDWSLKSMKQIDSMAKLANWTLEAYREEFTDCDVLVGHSLGGGLAFELSYMPQFKGVSIVLIDYFLSAPPPFFRNHCSDSTPIDTHDHVKKMILETKPYFNPDLLLTTKPYTSERLRERELVSKTKLSAIYGMRSEEAPERVKKHLGLDEDIHQYLNLLFLPRTAHFPMLERPQDFSAMIKNLLDT